jgi:hypothetical protein
MPVTFLHARGTMVFFKATLENSIGPYLEEKKIYYSSGDPIPLKEFFFVLFPTLALQS